MKLYAQVGSVLAMLALVLPPTAVAAYIIHVVGHGRVFVTPDVATVTVTVNRSANLSRTARTRVNRVIGRIVGGLVRIGVDRPRIQTSTITLNSSTTGRGHQRHRTFDAEVDLTVTIRRISLLSPLFDVASGPVPTATPARTSTSATPPQVSCRPATRPWRTLAGVPMRRRPSSACGWWGCSRSTSIHRARPRSPRPVRRAVAAPQPRAS